MNKVLLFTIFLAITKCEVGHWGVEESDHVAVLTKDNFDQFMKDHPKTFVKFYAPWCGHCKAMAAGYSSLAKRMKEENTVAIAKVDCTVEKELAERFGVQGFPTLKFFVDGEPVDYQGGREEKDIYNWLQKKTGPSSVEFTTQEQLDKHSKESFSVFFVSPQDDDVLKNYMNLAMGYDDVTFAHTHSDELKQSLDLQTKYNLVLFRDFDEGKKILGADDVSQFTTENLKKFLEMHRFPVVMDFDQKSAERIFGSESSAMVYFTDDSSDSGLQLFREFAKNNQNKVLYSHSTVTSGLGARLAEFLGVKSTETPTVRFIKFKSGQLQKFVVNELTNESFEKSLSEFLEGKLKAYYKSEPVPETNDEPVKVVVGNSFEDMVLKSDKFVLFEAYAPWCGHCKQLEPVYKELATKLAHVEDLVVSKMDATANEHPSLAIQGFPTIKLYKPGSETPVDYSGDRSLTDLTQFLEKEMGRKFEDLKTEEL